MLESPQGIPRSTRRKVFAATIPPALRPLLDLPGPDPLPGVGNLPLLKGEKRVWRLFARLRENHGGLCVFWKGPRPIVLVQDPDPIDTVLVRRELDFYKVRPIAELGPVLTVMPLVSNRRDAPTSHKVGEWERRFARSPLHAMRSEVDGVPWLQAQIEPVHDVVRRTVENVRSEEAFDLREVLRRLTWDVLSVQSVGRVFTDPEEDRYEDFWALTTEGDKRLSSKLLLPKVSIDFRTAFGRWAHTFDGLVDAARQPGAVPGVDLLSVVVREGTELSDRDLALEIGNVWMGGQMGISSLLLTTLHLLHRHPRVRDTVTEELFGVLGDGGSYSLPELERCVWLDAAIREAHRLLPAVPMFFRNCNEFGPVELGGYTLPPTTELLINSWGLHHDRAHWTTPEHFLPQRWHDAEVYEANGYGSRWFLPYGRGARACGGQKLAVHTLKVVLAGILREGIVDIHSPFAFEEDYFATVLSYRWLRATLRDLP